MDRRTSSPDDRSGEPEGYEVKLPQLNGDVLLELDRDIAGLAAYCWILALRVRLSLIDMVRSNRLYLDACVNEGNGAAGENGVAGR